MVKNRDPSPSTIPEAIDQGLQLDKELLDKWRTACAATSASAPAKEDIAHLAAEIKKHAQLYDSIGDRGLDTSQSSVGRTAKRIVRDRLLKTVPAARKIERLNAANIAQLHGILHPSNRVHDIAIADELEIGLPDASDHQEVEAPFDFSEVYDSAERSFDHDGSYAIHDWGVMGHDVDYRHSTDLWSGGSADKSAEAGAGVGFFYRMPADGLLNLTLVVRALSNDITFSISDNWGSSDSYLNFRHYFYSSIDSVSGHRSVSKVVVDRTVRSGGDDKSGSMTAPHPGQRFIINYTTNARLAQNENVKIKLSSQILVISYTYLMNIKLHASLNWHLEKVLLRVD